MILFLLGPWRYLLLLGPLLSALTVLLLARYFRWEGSAPLRAWLTSAGMRHLAIVVAFSPALTAAVLVQAFWRALLSPQPWHLVSLGLSSFGATALAASWLMLSRDPSRPLRPGRTIALAFAFWFANPGALWFVSGPLLDAFYP